MQNITDLDYTLIARFDTKYLTDKLTCIDNALRSGGIIRLANVPSGADEAWGISRRFFGLPNSVKSQYAPEGIYENGWISASTVNGSAEKSSTFSNVPEFFRFGPGLDAQDKSTGRYYPANRWPYELPDLQRVLSGYSREMLSIGRLVLRTLARALAIDESFFVAHTSQAMWSQGVNYYPSFREVGLAPANQSLLPSHTDFGTVSLIERESNSAPLQVKSGGVWFDVPHREHTIIVLLGDMLERWTGGRWQATQHRVLTPHGNRGDLVSLIFFLVADPGTSISPLPEPFGGGVEFEPIVASDYLLRRMATIKGYSEDADDSRT